MLLLKEDLVLDARKNINETQKYLIRQILEYDFKPINKLPWDQAMMALDLSQSEEEHQLDKARDEIAEIRKILFHPEPHVLLNLVVRNEGLIRITGEATVDYIKQLIAEQKAILALKQDNYDKVKAILLEKKESSFTDRIVFNLLRYRKYEMVKQLVEALPHFFDKQQIGGVIIRLASKQQYTFIESIIEKKSDAELVLLKRTEENVFHLLAAEKKLDQNFLAKVFHLYKGQCFNVENKSHKKPIEVAMEKENTNFIRAYIENFYDNIMLSDFMRSLDYLIKKQNNVIHFLAFIEATKGPFKEKQQFCLKIITQYINESKSDKVVFNLIDTISTLSFLKETDDCWARLSAWNKIMSLAKAKIVVLAESSEFDDKIYQFLKQDISFFSANYHEIYKSRSRQPTATEQSKLEL